MPQELPQFIHPLRLVKQGAELSGAIKISDLPRLQNAVQGLVRALDFELKFGRDSADIACIMGSLAGEVEMICQRCMQPMPVSIATQIALGVVQGEEEARQLPEDYEPLLVTGQPLKLNELIEDEALLALPFSPLHADNECSLSADAYVDDQEADSGEETHRPFAEQLAGLKKPPE